MLTRFDWCTLTSALVWPLASAGGWPSLPCFRSRSGTVGVPLLRSLQGRVRCCRYHGFVMPSGLHRSYGAHHLHFITCSCCRRLPFMSTARSRDLFLSTLEQMRQRYRFVVVGYVVMKTGDRRNVPQSFDEWGLVNVRLSPVSPETENGLAVDFRSPERLFDNRAMSCGSLSHRKQGSGAVWLTHEAG